MIEKFEDLELDAIETSDQIEKLIQDKLGVSIDTLKKSIEGYVIENSESLSEEFVTIAPMGDYGKLIENKSDISEFFKTEASKIENWILQSINSAAHNLIQFNFINKAVDDCDTLKGSVFVSLQGKIRHAFAQGDN